MAIAAVFLFVPAVIVWGGAMEPVLSVHDQRVYVVDNPDSVPQEKEISSLFGVSVEVIVRRQRYSPGIVLLVVLSMCIPDYSHQSSTL